MIRDAQGRCIKNGGGVAGQSLNAKDPPRRTGWSLRTKKEDGEAYDAMIRAAGYRGRPDALLDAFDLYAAVLGIGTLPGWVDITDFNAS